MTYGISELAKEFSITARTIRFYESEGLLTPSRQSNKRVYAESDRIRLRLVLRGKRLGFSLAEIKTTLSLYESKDNSDAQNRYVLELIEQHRRDLIRKQEDIVHTLKEMADVERRIVEAMAK